MSKLCDNKNPLFRDGTSQQQRLIKALLPEYVSVDERDMNDLIEFVNKFTSLIQYYSINNQQDGTWKELMVGQFIDGLNQKTEPHYALFIAFLELFRFAQEDVNTFTKRHLDFYYQDVLKLVKKSADPDQVFILLELAQTASGVLIPETTGLDGGEDTLGNALVYQTERSVLINKAKTVSFKALFYNKANDSRLYASPVANSKNGLGEEIESPEPKWRTFGTIADPSAPFNAGNVDRTPADVGFAIASPVLFMAEGVRIVQLTVTVNSVAGITNNMLADAFQVSFSGEEDWIIPSTDPTKTPVDTTYLGAPGSNTIIIQRTLTTDQEAVVAYNLEEESERFNGTWPVVKVILDPASVNNPFIYEALKGIRVNTVKIDVDVQEVRNIIVQNDNGVLDASKPFQPFGSRPQITSSFYIGSQEVFRKNLTDISVNLTWKGLPETSTGFYGYYQSYLPVITNASKRRTNQNFKAQVDILEGKSWKQLLSWTSGAARLFNEEPIAVSPAIPLSNGFLLISAPLYPFGRKLVPFREMAVTNNPVLNTFKGNPELPELESYSVNSTSGFLRLQLQNIDFGHGEYQNSYAVRAINAATDKLPGFPLPNEPYTPTISEISVNYSASDEVSLITNAVNQSADSFNSKTVSYYHIEPFGVHEVHPYLFRETTFANLLPKYNDEGTLYIGISNFTAPGTLSVLFKVAEGSSNPNLPVQTVKWSILSNNEWITLPGNRIISDSTMGLLTSGIIEFDLPKSMTANNSILPSELVWLKAAVENDSAAICDMIEIHAQAVTAVFRDSGNDPKHYDAALPAESITEFVNGIAGISEISQPYASFGGRSVESDEAYYIRVSERLRHKNRAVMIWDYERLVLEEFPKVYKVKCMNHTRYLAPNNIKEIIPGHVSLAVVANLRNHNAVNLLKPQSSLVLLERIREFISQINPPSVELHVKNPIYEEIFVRFNVRFHPGVDPGFHSRLLNDEIKGFLAPWAYEALEISFGATIEASVILNFIEKRPYVDYITCFEMDQITPTETLKNIQLAKAHSGASILTSVEEHEIYVLETEDCECDDNIVSGPKAAADCSCGCGGDCASGGSSGSGQSGSGSGQTNSNSGVGAGIVGTNFIVGNGTPLGDDGVGSMGIDDDFVIG
jgi:hypothetical protein